MAELSADLRRALASECAQDMGAIITRQNLEDFEQLRKLVSADSSASDAERTKAIYALGRWGNPTAVDDIERVMPELDDTGLIAAVDALGRLGTPSALKNVLGHSESPSPDVRKFVIRALGRFTDSEARDKLKEMREADPVPHLRDLALKHMEDSGKSE